MNSRYDFLHIDDTNVINETAQKLVTQYGYQVSNNETVLDIRNRILVENSTNDDLIHWIEDAAEAFLNLRVGK